MHVKARPIFIHFTVLFALYMLFPLQSCRNKQEAGRETTNNIRTFQENNSRQTDTARPSTVPAYPGTIHYELPDGYVLRIHLEGDEHGHVAKTTDGYYLLMNDEGFYEYAFKNQDNEMVSTDIKARNQDDRTEEEQLFLNKLTD